MTKMSNNMTEQLSFSYNPLLADFQSLAFQKNSQTEQDRRAKGLPCFDFTLGDPKEPTPSFILEALHLGIESISQYPSTTGSLELRTAAADWIKRRFQIEMNPQTEIISSNGSKEAVFHIPQVLLNLTTTKNVVVFPEPAYPIYKSGTILAGGRACQIPLKPSKNYVFDWNDIPQEYNGRIAALWVSYPHNPTGTVLTRAQAEKIYEWALQNNITLLSDECYIDSYFDDAKPPISFLEIAKSNNFKNMLSFFSLSKRSGMTGYRSGLIAGDSSILKLYAKYRLNAGVGTPSFIQNAAIAAWNDDSHVHERNEVFSKKRKLVEQFLAKNNIQCLKSQTTFYMWITAPKQYESAFEYCEKLKELGIFATPGRSFGESVQQYFRLALVPNFDDICEALKIWQNAIDVKAC